MRMILISTQMRMILISRRIEYSLTKIAPAGQGRRVEKLEWNFECGFLATSGAFNRGIIVLFSFTKPCIIIYINGAGI